MAFRRISGRAHLWRNAGTIVCALLFYYCVPLDSELPGSLPTRVITLVAFVAGVSGLTWLAYRRLRQFLTAARDTGHRVDGLLLLISLVVVFFALFYYVLELHRPEQFDGLRTRSDSLYYTVATLGTVGFGDVHAAGQAARIATTVQMVFDLVVIGALLAVMTGQITRRLDTAEAESSVPGARTSRADGGPG